MRNHRTEELTLPREGKENSNRRDELLSVVFLKGGKDLEIPVFKGSRAIQKVGTG